jgi:CheY-like chemotaxis protein
VDALPESPVQRKLLVVDDQRLVLDTLASMLTTAGYRVVCVPSGEGALAAARLTSFDAALVDIYMPVMDGFQTAVQLRQQSARRGRSLRIWHMTGMSSPAVEIRSAECGVMGLVLKPFDLTELCKMLEEGFSVPIPALVK